MMKSRRWIALAGAALIAVGVAVAGRAQAQTSAQVGQTTNGTNQAAMVGGRITGTNTMQDFQFDELGSLLTSYRFGFESALAAVSGDTIQIGKSNYSNPLTAALQALATSAPYTIVGPYLWVNVKVTGITSGYPWSVRFYATRDGTNYAPLMRSTTYWRVLPGTGVAAADDTLKLTRRAPTGSQGNWYPLMADPALPMIATQIIAVFSSDSGTATTGTTATVNATFESRK